MSVCLYTGGMNIVKKSGVGQAILHQKEALEAAGVDVEDGLSEKTEAVHINTVFPDSIIEVFRARQQGIKVIYYAHSTMEDFRNSFRGSNLLSMIFKKWIMFCYGMGDVILTPTEYSRQLLTEYGIDRPIYSISNGVDTDRFCRSEERRNRFRRRFHLKDDDPVVISVGHMIERKGILDYIELARSLPDVHFFWFGYTNPCLIPEHVHSAIENAPDNLVFPGYISQDELRDAYCGADLFAFLSKEETEGIVVLEALASHIPVLVRDIPVYDGWLVDGKSVYKADTLQGFVRRTEDILMHRLPDLSEYGRRVAESRSLQRIGQQLKAIYGSCL